MTRLQGDVYSDHELEQLDPALQQEFIRHQLAEMLLVRNEQGTPVQRVGETEQRVIDVILVLFNHILEDPALPDAMRALIGRLQIPVLKVAIQDPGFIHHENHPARRLVDDLARASMGWRDEDDRGDQSLYAQVKKAVERIVHEYREDVALFEEVRAEFAAYMENRERARKILEERLTQAVSGEERLTVAKLKVEELVRGLHPGVLPEAAREILEGPWKKLLTILWLREGEEGSNWKKAVEIAEMMGRYLGGAPRKFSRERLLSEIPEIISGLKKGFAYISLDQKKATNLLNGLQTCFINALRAEPFRPSVVGEEETVKPEASGEEAARDEAGSDAKAANEPDEFDEKVAAIGEGTWIRLSAGDGDGDVVTCKLVWRSKYTGTMVFVDGQGNKAAQLKEEELAEHFRSGSAEFLEDAQAPLIDRAIRKMMRVLNAEVVGLRLKMSD
ncbi:MAG TPA: DUF1631 family protein [Chromatiaceae bacterium]|nr:DUF1631 family protein [Chromatiaceae bacterium]